MVRTACVQVFFLLTPVPPPLLQEHDSYLARYHETGQSSILEQPPRELQARTKDDRLIPIMLMVWPDIDRKNSEIFHGMLYLLESKPVIDQKQDGVIVINQHGKILVRNRALLMSLHECSN